MRLIDVFMESAEVATGTVGTAVLLGISLAAGYAGYYNLEAAGAFSTGLLGGATLLKATNLMNAAPTETITPQ